MKYIYILLLVALCFDAFAQDYSPINICAVSEVNVATNKSIPFVGPLTCSGGYKWDFGGNHTSIGSGQNLTYSFSNPGRYVLERHNDGNNCDPYYQCQIVVNVFRYVGNITDSNGDYSVCKGQSIELTFNSTGVMSPKCWKVMGSSGGCNDEDGNNKFTFNSNDYNTGNHEIRVYDPDTYDASNTLTYARTFVTVNPLPSKPEYGPGKDMTDGVTGCIKKLSLHQKSGYTFSWDLSGENSDIPISTSKNVKVTKINNSSQCSSSKTFSVTPHTNTVPTPSFSRVSERTNSDCVKELKLTDDYENYNLSWNLSGINPRITSDKSVKLTLYESSTGCKKEKTKLYEPYGMPPGKIVQYDPLICESKFQVEELNFYRADLDHCKVESMDWDIPNSSVVKSPFVWIPKSSILNGLYGYDLLTHTHRIFEKTGSNPVKANIQYSCDKENIDERCYGTKVISENFNINAPVVDLIPKFDVSYCDVQFDYDFVAKPDYDLEGRVEYNILSQHWEFGDGNTSNMKAPTHVFGRYDRSYRVKLTVQYECPPCKWASKVKTQTKTFDLPEDVISQIDREETVEILSELLSSQASTLKSAWPLQNNNLDLAGLHPYKKGSAGVWRPYEGFAYNTNEKARLSTVNVNLKKDGTYEGHRFNTKSLIKSEMPGWLKGNTTTRYNGRSFEIENVNALEVYSAAVYDLAQQQPIAVGSNMNRSEMGFTSFEENRNGYEGNFFIGTGVPTLVKTLPILSGRKNVAIFDVPLAELVEYENGEVVSDEFGTTVNISCIDEEEVDGKMYSFMIFTESISSELYTGFFSAIVPPKQGEQNASSINSYEEAGHSGNQSLRVTNDMNFRQYFIELNPGKHYFLSAWVTDDSENAYYQIPKISDGLGLTITYRNKEGNQIGAKETLPPVGAIIEGWQQIAGEILVPSETEYFELGFKSGSSGTAYYDDLRLFPSSGNMTSYVYDEQFRVSATLDENNFATYYSYDAEGKMHLLRKETERGVQTIQESVNYVIPNEAPNE